MRCCGSSKPSMRAAGAIGAPPAVINALVDALGGKVVDMPATPEIVIVMPCV